MVDSDDNKDRDVRNRAYVLWERSGRPLGREHEFWALAAAELETGSANDSAVPNRQISKKV